MTSSVEELIEEASIKATAMNAGLVRTLDAAELRTRAKIPYKFLLFREALMWRTEELARNALSLFRDANFVSGIALTRCVYENAAAIWYAMKKIDLQIDGKSDHDIDEIAMSLVVGDRLFDDSPNSINVLTMIKQVEKDIKGFEKNYLRLCEFAHPNLSGTMQAFAKNFPDEHRTEFGNYLRGTEAIAMIGLCALNMALDVFIHGYDRIADLMPEFIRSSEKQLDADRNPNG